ncbi:trehalose operon transcriptional repressor [Klebsiella pneumoniae]|nr:trehalose operon transcriptional repressor [Klebsiella pneumoniae]
MQNRLTIKDIARLSGVGKSTVSRVLNNESGSANGPASASKR